MVIIGVFLLLFLCNYLCFIAARSTFSTIQGYNEIKVINQKENFIANLDPNSELDMGSFDKNDTQTVYDYLNENYNYALFTDGFVVSLPNTYDMEVSMAYLNDEYYNFNQFEIAQGENLDFDYNLDKNTKIPVLIGKGLSETYPLGTIIEIEDPVLQEQITLIVKGVLKENTSRSNFYALSSKQYYNFSVIVPVNEEYINASNLSLQLHGLFDLILLQTSKDKVEDLSEVITDNLNLKFNFFTQEENFEYFNEYYFSSLKIIAILTTIFVSILTFLSVWNSLVSVRLMIKDFTINLFVGLSYSRLRKILYGYYSILFLVNIVALFTITAYSRYGNWVRKDASFSTFGLFGIIEMDWLSLSTVLLMDIILGIIIVEIMLWRIKKVPISLGVLQ